MRKTFPLLIVLPLLIPMGLAAVFINVGTGPTTEQVLEDLRSPDAEVRLRALKWLKPLRRTTLAHEVTPLLNDPDAKVREDAVETLEKMKNPEALPALHQALVDGRESPRKILGAMNNAGYPQALDYFAIWAQSDNEEARTNAVQYSELLRRALNQEVCFYSVSRPIYNELGHNIYSQAILFPEGRAMAGLDPAQAAAPTP